MILDPCSNAADHFEIGQEAGHRLFLPKVCWTALASFTKSTQTSSCSGLGRGPKTHDSMYTLLLSEFRVSTLSAKHSKTAAASVFTALALGFTVKPLFISPLWHRHTIHHTPAARVLSPISMLCPCANALVPPLVVCVNTMSKMSKNEETFLLL